MYLHIQDEACVGLLICGVYKFRGHTRARGRVETDQPQCMRIHILRIYEFALLVFATSKAMNFSGHVYRRLDPNHTQQL